jgi:hypothetical protein
VGDIKEHREIREAATAIEQLERVDRQALAQLVEQHPRWVPALALAVGLSQESLRNILRQHFSTGGWVRLAESRPEALIAMLDDEYGLVADLEAQREASYSFGDVLVARAGTRQAAGAAIESGRSLEDVIERVAQELGLPYEVRTRFTGRNGQTAPCDLVIPGGGDRAEIVCAAKGFDSTGSKLSDAVREIVEMAEVRLPRQYVFAVVDGIGWLGRVADLRRIYDLWTSQRIDGLYTLAMLDKFVKDLEEAATRRGLGGAGDANG